MNQSKNNTHTHKTHSGCTSKLSCKDPVSGNKSLWLCVLGFQEWAPKPRGQPEISLSSSTSTCSLTSDRHPLLMSLLGQPLFHWKSSPVQTHVVFPDPIRCFQMMCASSGGRQLLRAVPFPTAQCADTIPRVPDNINAKQLSWTSSDIFFNISVVDWPLFFASTKVPENLQWPFRAAQYWPTISSTSETCASCKSMGQEWAYLYFKQRCVIFWVVTGLFLLGVTAAGGWQSGYL